MSITYVEGFTAEPEWMFGEEVWSATISIQRNPPLPEGKENLADDPAIVCYGENKEEAEKRRNHVLKALQAYHP